MNVRVFVLGVVGISALLLGGPRAASAQKTTEQFIPVGQSPGLSGKHTVIGTVQAVNARDHTVTIAGPAETRSATVTDRTRIWLHQRRMTPHYVTVTLAALRQGVTRNINHDDPTGASASGPAQWT